jgi:aquaporin Z
MSTLSELRRALRHHWPAYLAEAAGLAFFVTCSSLLMLALEHPASPVQQLLVAHGASALLRRVPMGIGMGLVLVLITYCPWGRRSGAHINPAVTLAFWQLGRIRGADAIWYGLAQAAGGIGALQFLAQWLAPYYANPRIHFITTQPGPGGPGVAFAAEFGMSGGLMTLLLLTLRSARWRPATGWLAGALLGAYIVWESPYSGMSLNPSRSLAAAVVAHDFAGLWIYLLAPTAAMWLVAVAFQRLQTEVAARPASSGSTSPAELPFYPTTTPEA